MGQIQPLVYLTIIMIIVTVAIAFGVVALNIMNIRIKKIEEKQDLEYQSNEELRHQIKEMILVIKNNKQQTWNT